MEIIFDFTGFLEALREDGLCGATVEILKRFRLQFYIEFYGDSRTCALNVTTMHNYLLH